MIPIIMPQVGQDIPTATIVEWLKEENAPVEKGEVILIVESDKAAFEVEAEETGVLSKILYGQGEEVEIFKPVAYIGQPGEVFEEKIGGQADGEVATQASFLQRKKDRPKATSGAETHLFASPSARRIAREVGVDLRHVQGSGPHNRITKRDVLAAASSLSPPDRAAEAPQAQPTLSGDTVIVFDKMRKRIADRLTLSKQTIPHFYLTVDVDMSEALEWRAKVNEKQTTGITITDMIIKACALALATFERMNAHVGKEKIVLKQNVNIGIAISVNDGLLVPVIPDADKKSLIEIAEISKKNAAAARRGFVSPHSVGTFTITTLGMYSISQFLPIINPPECAILAVGAIEQRVVPVDGAIAVRNLMSVTLAADHRAVDGVCTAQFLNQIKEYLETSFSDTGGSGP